MTTYLLAIGINHYTDRTFRALSCCENDATELHSLFKRNLELGDRARKLVGAVSIVDVKNELQRIGQEIRNGDTFVFFFAGHGYQHPRKEDQYLLFPDAAAVLVNKGHRDGMLALSALRDLTEHWTGVARVFILDACRSWLPGRGTEGARFDNEATLAYLASRDPAFGAELTSAGDATTTTGSALAPVILNATRNGQEARELEDRQRGVLALALEHCLESQQQSGQVIYLGERLLGDVSRRMNELLQHGRLGVEQTPFLTPPTAKVLLFKPPRAAAAETPLQDEDDDETDWAIACAKGALEAYEGYARRKPPGKYRAKALEKIAELSQPKPSEALQTPPLQSPRADKPEAVAATHPAIDTAIPAPPAGKPEPVVEAPKPPIDNAGSGWKVGLGVVALIVVVGATIVEAYRSWTQSKGDAPLLAPAPAAAAPAAPDHTAIPPSVAKPKPASLPAPLSVFRDKLKNGGEGPAMVVIPAGEFDMGSNDSDARPDEKPVHLVSIKQPFAIGRTEVTQKEWRQLMGSDPAELIQKGCDDCAADNVSWHDAQRYIEKLNEQTGKKYTACPARRNGNTPAALARPTKNGAAATTLTRWRGTTD